MSERRHFLKCSSIGLLGTLFQTGQLQRKRLLTVPHDRKLRVVCIGAHPGDPEFGCGGTMATYSDAGHHVTFLYLTRGEAYDSSKTHQEAAIIRTREAEAACRALHTKPMFFGQTDGDTVCNVDQARLMSKTLSSLKPNLVFTQWPIDTHPDHQVTGMLTLAAWTKLNKAFDIYFYEVNSGSETMLFSPTAYVDISKVADKKKAAMFAHMSQDPQGTYDNFFRKMEEFRGLEANVRSAEAFVVLAARQPG